MTSPQGRKPHTDTAPVNLTDPDNPEWTDADFAQARPAAEVLSPEVIVAFGKKRGRPRVEDPKRPVNLRLSARVLDHYKAGGSGWQTRMNADLEALVTRNERGVSHGRNPSTGQAIGHRSGATTRKDRA